MQTELFSLSKIFTENLFRIPDYQRGYSWTERQLKDFWSDLALLDKDRDHYTGVLTLELVGQAQYEQWTDDLWIIRSKRFTPYYVVDGQQRLTTSLILLQSILERLRPGEELNYSTADEIRKKFIFESRDKGVSRSYVFGYEKDNPSYEFLKTKIFLEASDDHGTGEETIYTHNLLAAKKFFGDRVKGLHVAHLEELFAKLTQHFLFNIYTIAGHVDVFVAFETMNNRGKPLSYLELLKNRLIFLSTRLEVDLLERQKIRAVVNESWKTAYHYLGRNQKRTLDDDHFLFVQFMLYFDWDLLTDGNPDIRFFWRTRRDEFYKTYLLDIVFTTRNLRASGLTKKDALVVSADMIYGYAHDIKRRVQEYYRLNNPDDSDFSDDAKTRLAQLHRLGWTDAIALAMVALEGRDEVELVRLLSAIERLLFLQTFRAVPRSAETDLVHHAKRVKDGKASILEAAARLESIADRYLEDGRSLFGSEGIQDRSFYSWRGIRYFLFEYEQELKSKSKSHRDKILWEDFVREDFDHDYETVEHIYPQKAAGAYWQAHYGALGQRQGQTLRNSLGNLLALSRPKNAALSNRSFPEKRDGTRDTTGYRAGSYSEIEVAEVVDWTPHAILERGLRMLAFMERRWRISLGDETAKIRTLGLEFLTPSK